MPSYGELSVLALLEMVDERPFPSSHWLRGGHGMPENAFAIGESAYRCRAMAVGLEAAAIVRLPLTTLRSCVADCRVRSAFAPTVLV